MKPCSKNRKLLAWLALGNLDDKQATALREHVATCEGCRCYLDELAKVTASISGAVVKTDIVATASFHRRVVAAVKAEERRTVWPTIERFLRGTLLNRRVALATVGGIAVVLVVGLLLTSGHRSEVPLPTPSSARRDSAHNLDADFRPTIANYQMVANQSLEKLDQLLSEQASRRLPPAPIYTASTFMAADVSN
jgi:anti-sigma factor RsiW